MKKIATIISLILVSAILLSTAGCGASTTLNAKIVGLIDDDFLQRYAEEGVGKEAIIEGFGFTESELDSKYANALESWRSTTLEVTLSNSNSFDVVVLGLKIEENGKDDVFVSTLGDSVVTRPANNATEEPISFNVLSSGAKTDEEILKIIKGMDIQIIYADAATEIESIEDADEADLKYEKFAA